MMGDTKSENGKMNGKMNEQKIKEIEKLLIDDESGNEEEVTDLAESQKNLDKMLGLKHGISKGTVVTLAAFGFLFLFLLVVMINESLREQFEALLSGEIGKYKAKAREQKEIRFREIENLTENRYGSVILMYSPRDAKVRITEKKYTITCNPLKDEDTLEQLDLLLKCLKQSVDYSKPTSQKEIDNKTLHLKEKELIEQLPLENVPIRESAFEKDKTVLEYYDYHVLIERDGYKPRKFLFTYDRQHPPIQDTEIKFWEQRGPGLFMADFSGVDLMMEPETAKANFIKAMIDIKCMEKRIAAEKKALPQGYIDGIMLEIKNRHNFKTNEEFNEFHSYFTKDKLLWKEIEKEISKGTCQ